MSGSLAVAILAACGSDDSNGPGAGSDAGGGSDGTIAIADAAAHDADGSTTTTTAEGGAGGTGGGAITACLTGSSPDAGPTAACATFEQCAQSSCNSQFVAAFGADWTGGTVSGACAGFYQCASAAGCGKNAISGCESSISAICGLALAEVEGCLQGSCTPSESACNASIGGLVGPDGGATGDAGDAAADAD